MKPTQPIPPALARKFLLWFLRDDLAEEVLGDLNEQFQFKVERASLVKARLNYWYQVFNYLRPFAISKSKSTNSNHYAMFQNYFKIGWRNLFKNKGYSFINIGGLAVGMSVAILISLWVYDEVSFNKYHQNYDRIALLKRHQTWQGQISTENWHGSALGNLLHSSYKNHLEHVVMASRIEEHIISSGDKNFSQLGNFMGSEAPKMLTLKMLHGTRDGLKDKNSVLLSKTLANKLFGDIDPINKVVTIDANSAVTVTGIYEDLPHNSEFWEISYIAHLDLFFSITGFDRNVWSGGNMLVYIQLHPSTDFDQTSVLIKDVMLPHVDKNTAAKKPKLFLHPMSQWHLHSKFENGLNVTSEQLQFVRLYSIIGLFVLLLACINFINLSTARSEKRAKEIGVRKSIGSNRHQLISQFLSESLLVAILAFVLSLAIVGLILPWFNEIAGKETSMPWANPWFWVAGLGFTSLTGLLAGSYPALYLSSFNPVKSLKGTFRVGHYAAVPRKVLVVFQFTVSVTLIIGTLIVYQQIQYAKNRPVGYSRNGLLMIPKRAAGLHGKYDMLRHELKKTGAVVEIAEADYPLTNTNGNNGGFDWAGKDPSFRLTLNTVKVNYEYGKTVGWELIEGRDFSRDFGTDVSGVIIAESTRKLMGLGNPIGEKIHYKWASGGPQFTVLGVFKDMVKGSPFQSPYPAIMFLSEKELFWMFIRLNPQISASEALSKIEAVFKKIAPSSPFDYKFMDEEYNAKFRTEERIGKLATFFAVLAVLISCLGLFGLAAFVAEKRTKEIGIRKVFGASVINLWQMLSRDFVVLIVFSCLIAVPIAYYFLQSWLQQYTYRIEISWWIFALAGLGALVITLLTVSHQAIKAATTDPVKSLRNE